MCAFATKMTVNHPSHHSTDNFSIELKFLIKLATKNTEQYS